MEHAAAMQRDDAPAFEALLEEHRGIVLKVAAGYARNLHDRADGAAGGGRRRHPPLAAPLTGSRSPNAIDR